MTNYFINILHSSSFFPKINTFTSVSDTYFTSESIRTIVDNILTNSLKVCIDSVIIFSDVKSLSHCFIHWSCKKVQYIIIYKDLNTACNALINEITNSMDCTILKRFIKQGPIEQKCWLTKGILKSIKKRIIYTNDLLKTLVIQIKKHIQSIEISSHK